MRQKNNLTVFNLAHRTYVILSSDSKKIAVVGLGYVGLPLAAEFGKSRTVVGFDISRKRVEELRDGKDTTLELTNQQLQDALYLSFSSDIEDIRDCQLYIVTVPTPIDSAKRPDLRPLKSASHSLGQILKAGDIVIYESTVFPGCTEEVCVPILEEASGLKFNEDFFCGYSPERINPGDKVNTLTKIKKITSGSTPEIADEVDCLYDSVISAGTFKAASLRVAEAAKVIENSQRDLNIAFVNELSLIFDRLNIDTIQVLEAAGSKWNFLPFRPGMVGGHCIGVDPYYLTHKAEEVGYNPQVVLAGRRINDQMARYSAGKIIKSMLQNGLNISQSRIGIFGVTFKENCPDIRNSKIFDLIHELLDWNANIVVVDDWADPNEVESNYGLRPVKLQHLPPLSSIIVAVGHNEFRQMSPAELRNLCNGENPVLGDLKALFDREECEAAGFTVFRL